MDEWRVSIQLFNQVLISKCENDPITAAAVIRVSNLCTKLVKGLLPLVS